ncbi:hypothetical protein [Klebsiella variicola]|uniref:hypothetical protein n=1 Tax=Klebsiella variicola TaxID=244366 RepID=UPI0011227A31|nr:hypothetical protein [Klebsiella variicola]TPE10926.1 hypothetical protein FJP66_08410 [Klebsiella variicola]TPE27436.1 hypothetical protein FJP63_13115 [Klebsiella variicola]
MDTIRYLPDFLIQNLNYVTIMAAFIPLILFTMNIFLIKRKMKIDNSQYYYHYTTKIGFEKIRQTKTIEGVNYGFIYATTNIKNRNLGYSLFSRSKKKYFIIIKRTDKKIFKKNTHGSFITSILFPNDIFKILTEEVISCKKNLLTFNYSYERSSRVFLVKQLFEKPSKNESSVKLFFNRIFVSFANATLIIMNLSSIVFLILIFTGESSYIKAAMYILITSFTFIFLLCLPLILKTTYHYSMLLYKTIQ